ncbi:MAG TPA: C4-type zinc ribbon domain-containing protein [Mycobacteriales bacterium]
MKADPTVQQRLLALQAHDAALARLEHRRRTLPELTVIAEADTRLTALRGDVVRAETEVGDLDRELRRLEDDVDQVRRRSERDQQRMQAGSVPAKELESLQHEVESLARRQSDLEDTELEVMERREDAETRAAGVRAEVATVTESKAAAEKARDAAYEQIDADAAADTRARAAIAAEMPADLLALYEKVRAVSGGVGAAELRARRCEGCRLELAGGELRAARAAAPDEVLRCENCRRILVRTAESGL